MASRAQSLVRGLWSAILRLTLYLAPLLRDALVHLWRIGLDAADGAQYLWRRWRAGRQPDTATRLDAWRRSMRERRALRWAPWGTLTSVRRVEVRAASVALVLIALVVARASSDRESPAAAASPSAIDSAPEPTRAPSPGLTPGASESWNGFRVAAPAVLREGDGFRLWYRGCRLHGVEHDCAIGHASSTDGLQWTTTEDAVLVPSDDVDEFDLGWIAVSHVGDTYFLWYSVAPDEFDSRPTSVLHLATSDDGLRWLDHGRVLTTEERTVPVQPSVVHDGSRFHLWFSDTRRRVDNGYEVPDGGPFLRHFTSQDGRSWQEAGEHPMGPLGLGRVRMSMTRETDGSYRGFFFSRVEDDSTGDVASSVGWLTSADGIAWRIDNKKAVTTSALGSDVRQITDAAGLRVPAGVLAWFVIEREDDRLDIRAAFYKE